MLRKENGEQVEASRAGASGLEGTFPSQSLDCLLIQPLPLCNCLLSFCRQQGRLLAKFLKEAFLLLYQIYSYIWSSSLHWYLALSQQLEVLHTDVTSYPGLPSPVPSKFKHWLGKRKQKLTFQNQSGSASEHLLWSCMFHIRRRHLTLCQTRGEARYLNCLIQPARQPKK